MSSVRPSGAQRPGDDRNDRGERSIARGASMIGEQYSAVPDAVIDELRVLMRETLERELRELREAVRYWRKEYARSGRVAREAILE